MKPATLLATVLALAALPGCGDGSIAAHKAAVAVFDRFQAAMFARDRSALRELVTAESRDAIAELPLGRLAHQQPLAAVDCHREGTEYWVTVQDPNQGDHRSVFVIVREDCRLVVDLLATSAHQATYTPHVGPPVLEPRQLTDAERERVRQMDPASLR